jgi:hypothetical protein
MRLLKAAPYPTLPLTHRSSLYHNERKPDMTDHWEAFCTINWFLTGRQLVGGSPYYYWYLEIEDRAFMRPHIKRRLSLIPEQSTILLRKGGRL